jgi:quinol monooxygenase YgiN
MSDSCVRLELSFHIRIEGHREFRQLADAVLRGKTPRGCLDRGLFSKLGEPVAFLWVEHWRAGEQLVSHLLSAQHRALVGGIRVLGALHSERVLTLDPATQGASASCDEGVDASSTGRSER